MQRVAAVSDFILLKDQYIFQFEDAEEINYVSFLPRVVFPLKRLSKGEVPDLGPSLGGL